MSGDSVGGHVLARLDRSLDVVKVPEFIDLTFRTADVRDCTVHGLESGYELCQVVLDRGAGIDASSGEPNIGGKGFEELDGLLEEVGDFLSGSIVGIALSVESRHAGSVLAPLMKLISTSSLRPRTHHL